MNIPPKENTFRRKIKTREQLREAIGPRPRVNKVIMCHGTFDLVHPGHIRHLMYAKDQGGCPRREPDIRFAHQQGELPPFRTAGFARHESRRARVRRLRHHRR